VAPGPIVLSTTTTTTTTATTTAVPTTATTGVSTGSSVSGTTGTTTNVATTAGSTTGVPTTTAVPTTTSRANKASDSGSGGTAADSQLLLIVIVVAVVLCLCFLVAVCVAVRFRQQSRRLQQQDPVDMPHSTLATPGGGYSPGTYSAIGTAPGTPSYASQEGAYQRFNYLPLSALGTGVSGSPSNYQSLALDPEQLQVDQSTVIGRGEYGIVYKGTFRGEEVAVKHMLKSADDGQMAEFLAEADLMEKIPDHENVLRFIGLISHAGLPAIVTEFCSGSSLQNAITHSALDETTLWLVVRGIAAGMCHLSRANVVHRDLACRNVLLDSKWNPKVCE
jgi:Protein tyrosine and serine/threonine kinase